MSLLQISEPNQSKSPHQHRYALGIDLGTTHSLVAVVRSGRSEVLALVSRHCCHRLFIMVKKQPPYRR